jgi:hypothetical protein
MCPSVRIDLQQWRAACGAQASVASAERSASGDAGVAGLGSSRFALGCGAAAAGLRAGSNDLTLEMLLRHQEAPALSNLLLPAALASEQSTIMSTAETWAPVCLRAQRRLVVVGGAAQLSWLRLRLSVLGVGSESTDVSVAYPERLKPGLAVAASGTIVLSTETGWDDAAPEASGTARTDPLLQLTLVLACDVCGHRNGCAIITVAHASTSGRLISDGGLRAPLGSAVAELAGCAHRAGGVLVTVHVAAEFAETIYWSAGRLHIDGITALPVSSDHGAAVPCDVIPLLPPGPGPRVPSRWRLLSVGVTTAAVCAAFARLVWNVRTVWQGSSLRAWTPALAFLSVGFACVLAALAVGWLTHDIRRSSVVLGALLLPTVAAGRACCKQASLEAVAARPGATAPTGSSGMPVICPQQSQTSRT